MDDAVKGVLVIVGLIYFGYRLGENSSRRVRPTLLDKAESVTDTIEEATNVLTEKVNSKESK